MNRLQKWFDQIVGISQEERQRWALAHQIFGGQHLDTASLQIPACWRRKARTALPRRG